MELMGRFRKLLLFLNPDITSVQNTKDTHMHAYTTHTVELRFIVPWFKVFCHLTFSSNGCKSIISTLNSFHLRYSFVGIQIHCIP
jgi:hypothetical protein